MAEVDTVPDAESALADEVNNVRGAASSSFASGSDPIAQLLA
jgi:hypothetical protein